MGRMTWLRRTATYVVTATMTGFGFTSIASAQTITNTGPGSHNNITSNVTNNCSVTNNNRVSAYNSNRQQATTGDANVSDNTTAGVSWAGWSALDPTAAQAAGISYASWWSGVVNWIAQRASGDGWNSASTNLSWAPGGADWSGFDPVNWQANGQSFGNWYNSVEAYLNSNSPTWVMTWPADATGSMGLGGAYSGNATNNYNANFSININNAASAAAGTDSCGRSNFTPPPSGGMGGGSTWTPPAVISASPQLSGGQGGGSGSGGYYSAPRGYVASAPVAHASTPVQSTPSPSGGMGGGGGTPAAPSGSSISNTGPGSTNNVTSNYTNNSSVTNNNCVTVSNFSSQTASTGDANVSGNTTTGGGGSGDASNANGTGGAVGITN